MLTPFDEAVNPVDEARAIVEELRKYDEGLYGKERWLVLNKMDMVAEDERAGLREAFLRDFGWEGKSFIISALSGEGCKELTYAIMDYLMQNRAPVDEAEEVEEAEVVVEDVEDQVDEDSATD